MLRRKDGCLCEGTSHWKSCDRPDVALAREAATAPRATRYRRLIASKIIKMCLVAHPDGGGHDAAECVRKAVDADDAAEVVELLTRAVVLSVSAGAAASEMGDHGRRAAWLRVRDVGATL